MAEGSQGPCGFAILRPFDPVDAGDLAGGDREASNFVGASSGNVTETGLAAGRSDVVQCCAMLWIVPMPRLPKASGFKSVHVVSVSRLKVPVVATQTFIKSGLRFLKKVVAT